MPVEHIIVGPQTAWETWVTPDKAIPVDTWSADPGIERNDRRLSGAGRALSRRWPGKKLVTGSFEMPCWEEYMGLIWKAAGLNDITSTRITPTTGVAYEHGIFPDDSAVPAGLSVQMKRDGTHAQNLLGVLINTLTLSCAAGEPAIISGEWIAKDEAPTGGYWDYDRTEAAPAVVASPAYFATDIMALMFYGAAINVGGTLTWDATKQVFSLTGGTDYADIELIEVGIENNWDARVFLGNKTAKNVVGQDRAITCKFDLDQSTINEVFYSMYRDGTNAAMKLTFTGRNIEAGNDYEHEVVLPLLDFGPVPMPDISGSQDRRMQSVSATAMKSSHGMDIAARIVDKQASY